MNIAVGSANPVKIAAIKQGFEQMMPGIVFEVTGYDVASGVSDQPLSDAETIKGATNRAYRALKQTESAAFGVGLEGGLQEIEGKWYDAQWAVIVSRSGAVGQGQSVRIPMPDKFMPDILAGKELGDVIDAVFAQTNMKQAGGYIGEVTHGTVSREAMCLGAVFSALIPITNPELF